MSASPRDRYDQPLSTTSGEAAERYVEGIDRLFAANADADVALEAAIAADEGFAVAYSALAAVRAQQGRGADARRLAARGEALAAGATGREVGQAAVIARAVNGDGAGALALASEQLERFPRDAMTLFQASGVYQLGSPTADRQQQRLALLERQARHYGDDWWFLSALSFSHHELDHFEESRRLSERSLEQRRDNAGAAHNIGHVYYETNGHVGGAGFLSPWLAEHDERRAPLYSHLVWHLALFELNAGHHARAMELYDDAIRPGPAQTRPGLWDAASLLWRYQLYGAGSDLPWADVCAVADVMTAQPGLPFADAHAALAYAAAGDEAGVSRLLDAFRELETKGHPIAGGVMRPLVLGIQAFAHGNYDEAIRQLEPIQDQVIRIGGSNAQREVFEDTLLEAYLRAGRHDRAEPLLRRRLDRRPSARDYFWLGRAEVAAGQRDAAAVSLANARSHWSEADADSPELAALTRL